MSAGALGALSPILERKRDEAARLRCSEAALWARATTLPPARDFAAALRGGALVAELKRRSPSGGELRTDLDPGAIASSYAQAGAAALSVLTDGPDFGGRLEDLVAAREATALPTLRKDFVVDPVQVAEARVAGADCVLLIVAALGAELLERCIEAAGRCGVCTLVEVHDEAEAAIAVAAGAAVIGVNNRDLHTLRSDLSTFARLRPLLGEATCVAESGVREPADAARLVSEGADAVLAGEALMRSGDPAAACRHMAEACRAAAGRQ